MAPLAVSPPVRFEESLRHQGWSQGLHGRRTIKRKKKRALKAFWQKQHLTFVTCGWSVTVKGWTPARPLPTFGRPHPFLYFSQFSKGCPSPHTTYIHAAASRFESCSLFLQLLLSQLSLKNDVRIFVFSFCDSNNNYRSNNNNNINKYYVVYADASQRTLYNYLSAIKLNKWRR